MINLNKDLSRVNRDKIVGDAKYLGGYGGALRDVCHSIKKLKVYAAPGCSWGSLDKSALTAEEMSNVCRAMQMLQSMLPPKSIIIPLPGRNGNADVLARLLMNTMDNWIVDIDNTLVCNPHESAYERKKRGEEPEPLEMAIQRRDESGWGSIVFERNEENNAENIYVLPGYTYFLFDNVIDTGATMAAALKLLPFAKPLAVAVTGV